ncbi:MAG: 2,3-bisphosphoglycerate-independent phosphoglycerate mutase, partial [Lysobacterales bacterium]
MKFITIVPDGMADLPIEELGGKTPLQAARTTNMDYLATRSMVGLIQTIPEGMAPGSDIGNMSLLGYDPTKVHTGRAPLEAVNQNIHLADDEIAIRCNFVTLTGNNMTDYSAGHISTDEAAQLIQTLDKEIDLPNVKFYPGKSYRHTVVMKVLDVQKFLELKTTPPHDILGKDITPYLPEGEQAVMFLKLMERSREILKKHPINKVRSDLNESPADMIWLWGQGSRPKLEPFNKKYGVNGAIISAVDLVNGIGRLAGLKVIDVPGATGYYDTDYKAKGQYALEALKDNDYVYIHVEAPDEAGHNGDAKAKTEAIERIDQDIIGPILNNFNEHDDVRILILPDHPTPVSLRTHTSDPVPFLMYGKGITADPAETLSEVTATEKGL